MSAEDDNTLLVSGATEADLDVDYDLGPDGGKTVQNPVMLSRYVLLHRIGAGGLGVVFAAYDPDLDRKVAIKLLRSAAGDGSAAGRARLVREAQAMARLSHPNVIAVHDVGVYDETLPPGPGTERSGVFVVMELVDGVDLAQWCGDEPRAWKEIVATFVAAGNGLQAAHEAGIVHRDFKPSNVLIAKDGRVRVLDFGIARSAGDEDPGAEDRPDVETSGSAEVGLANSITKTGGVLGTPAYMAPEQHFGLRAEARSDQYAFCIALYEALYRRRPFEAHTLRELGRLKRKAKIPPPPNETAVPRWVDRCLRRGLESYPDKRYPDMAALLRDLSTRRRSRKWWAAGGLGAAIGLAIASFLPGDAPAEPELCTGFESMLDGVWDDAARHSGRAAFESTELPYAVSAWAVVQRELDQYTRAWVSLRQDACVAAKVENRETADAMRRRHRCLDAGVERVRELAGVFAEADAAVVERAVEAVEVLPALRHCVEGPVPGVEEYEAEAGQRGRVERALARASALLAAGRHEASAAAIEEAEHAARDPEHPASLARALEARGELALEIGDSKVAADRLMEALAFAERSADHRVATLILARLVVLRVEEARTDDASHLLLVAKAKFDRHRLDPQVELQLLHVQGSLADRQGRFEAAAELGREALALAESLYDRAHTEQARAYARIASASASLGRYEEAERNFAAALEIYETRLGPEHPSVASVLGDLATVQASRGRTKQSVASHRRALAVLERAYGVAHPRVARATLNLAAALLVDGNSEEALRLLRQTTELLESSGRDQHPDFATTLTQAAKLLSEKGESQRALDAADQAIAILERSLGERHPQTAAARAARGRALFGLERYREGLTELEAAREIWGERLGEKHPTIGLALKTSAEIELQRGRRRQAMDLFLRAIAILEAAKTEPRDLAVARLLLARTLQSWNARRARDVANKGIAAFMDAGGDIETLRALAPWAVEAGFIEPPPETEADPSSPTRPNL